MSEHQIIADEDGVEIEDTSHLGNIDRPFDPKKVDITTKQMILEVIFRRLRNDEIALDTSFQRNANLWNATKQSRLIESILVKLPLPAFYFDGSEDDKWLIVDGLQRLSTFKNYVIDKTLRLHDLEFLAQFNDYSFDELPRELQRRIEEHEITVYIINPGTPNDVKFNLFRRINTAGLFLTPQEIRHALNQGIPADFVMNLAELSEFKQYKINPKRMLDRDFVTRFIAFYTHSPQEYKPDLDNFLHNSMAELNKYTEAERNAIRKDFKKALSAAKKIFGEDAFRKRYSINDRRKPMNKALFEVWTVNLSKLERDKIIKLIKNKKAVKKEFIHLLNTDEEFDKSISTSTGDRRRVQKRFEAIEELIKQVVT
jgi:hypothetical protein